MSIITSTDSKYEGLEILPNASNSKIGNQKGMLILFIDQTS
jgi:hypothetical protein